MAIKNRQGKSQDFVPTKLVSGEFAVVQEGDENTADGSALYLATKAGSVKRIPFATEVEDLKTQVDNVVEDAREAIAGAIDPTLTQSGKAADAKKTGDEIADLKSDISQIKPGLSDEAVSALLACFRGVAWLNWEEGGESLYNALSEALNVEPPEPTPTFNYGVYMQTETVNGKYIDASGTVIDGEANESFYIPDYIPVIRESYWIAMQPATWVESTYGTPRSEANWRVTEYDAQKVFIKQTQYSNSTAYSAVEHTFDANTKYVRLGWYDPYSSAIKHFDIENPATITALPMESGDISASDGQNATQALRIRTTGYIDVADETLTFAGCPFADTWSEFTANTENQTSVYGVRCYGTNKNFLGVMPAYKSDISNVTLLSGTKYIRFIIQYANSGTFANFKELVNHLITINGTKYFVAGV